MVSEGGRLRRARRIMDLPHLPVHEGGKMDKEEVHHFWRSLEQWTEEIEAIAAEGCPCVGFTGIGNLWSSGGSNIANGESKVIDLTIDHVWDNAADWDDSGSGSIIIDPAVHGVYDVSATVYLNQNTGTGNVNVFVRLYCVTTGRVFAANSRSILTGMTGNQINVSGTLPFYVDTEQAIGIEVEVVGATARSLTLTQTILSAFKKCECTPYRVVDEG